MYKLFSAASAAALIISTEAHCQQATYGVAGYYGGGAQWTYYSTDSNGYTTATTTLNDLPPNAYNEIYTGSFPFSLAATTSNGGATAGVSFNATPQNGNVGLHGYANTSLTGSPYEQGGSDAGFDLYSYDTFHIGGDAGQYEQFLYTLTLNGTATSSSDGNIGATRAYGELQLYLDSNWIEPGGVQPFASCTYYNGSSYFEANGNACGPQASIYLNEFSPNSQTLTGILTLAAGTTVQLGELLWARDFTSQATSGSATFDASDTGYFTLVPMTPGASFTTESGLNYAQSPEVPGSVPEPATWAMMLLGLGAAGLASRTARQQLKSESA